MQDRKRKIALEIVRAQIASDAGKGIYELSCINCESAVDEGYYIKDAFVLHAVKLIETSRDRSFDYYCVRRPDQNGYDSTLVYFTYNELQVSFHVPASCCIKIQTRGQKRSGKPCEWDHKSSREACQRLIGIFGLEG